MKCKLLIILFLLYTSCSNTDYRKTKLTKTKKADIKEIVYNCNDINNKTKLFAIADSIMKSKVHENIINLQEIISKDPLIIDDNFIYPDKKSRIVFFLCSTGFSAGNSNNLLILFHCDNKKAKIIWSGQYVRFNKKNIEDINNDGIKEITATTKVRWMSSERKLREIINFKNCRKNIIYNVLFVKDI